ncbi:YihY/virulence factor BrkB family protein [Lapidilactobacillus gannanensis]|jgi:membrane protein|uniref:YihY/virulence factor BrkB family protein n=1 Tax=Lapidilactobacillus gannanensis TaxID=2486002 RepID=A0ABW4BK50_9LACO|nr:YihY/virulence factor BrkB family protein [Lapidilactobacillus gannanensis]MCH4056690.1 YihY/virulence factor BrkB family protein [Lactobacillaceae bacterium]
MTQTDVTALPLFRQPIPWYRKLFSFIQQIVARVISSNIGNAAKVITYYVLLAFFPMVIFVGNMLPYLGLDAKTVMTYLDMAFPEQLLPVVRPIVISLLGKSNGGLLSIGVIATLWAGSRALNAIRYSMNDAYQVDNATVYSDVPFQNAIVRRFFAFILTFIFIVSLLLIIVAFTFGQQFLEWVVPTFHWSEKILITFTRWKWPVIVTVVVVVLLFLQYILPNVHFKFWTVLPGTTFTAIGWLVLTQGFTLYVKYFAKSFNSYGTIGTVIVGLLWLNFAATLLMIGVVINAVFNEAWHGTSGQSPSRIARFLRNR